MTLHHLLIDSARRRPDAVAVHDPDGPTTYGDLDRLADAQATGLRRRGVRPGDRVVVWTGKHVAAVAAMQAALRVGAVYVPLSPAIPVARVAAVARDACAALVLADADRLAATGVAESDLDLTPLADLPAEPTGHEPHQAASSDPAFVLYTSGSTGTPKGVCISHANALAFIAWAVADVKVTAADRLANHAPFTFDLSVFDLYAAFAAGASVHLVPQELAYAPEHLVAFLHERRITVWYSVPSALTLMMREGGLLDRRPPDLRVCVFAGEVFALRHVRALRAAWPGVRLLNWYGPTETNVCTAHEVTAADLAADRPLPIGSACSGDRVDLVDQDADGIGEIVVDGPTVMLGYWGAPPQVGPYRTGDLARRDADGLLRLVGRRDHLVKVRGHRVELAEIELVIAGMDAVADAAVLVAGAGHRAALHAFVVGNGRAPSLIEVKRRCAERLPTYMVVDRVHVVADLPRTANGKTDRAALLAQVAEAQR